MRRPGRVTIAAGAALVAVALAGAGRLVWREHAARAFAARYTPMNEHYKQALLLTGQGQRGPAIREYDAFLAALGELLRPQGAGLPGGQRTTADLERVTAIARGAGALVREGDLASAHLALEEVRPILNEVLRRNGLSALRVALTDFHDQMERVIAAGKVRDARAALAELPVADAKLRAVERELSDARVEAIRGALERVRALAERGQEDALPDAVGALKSAFVRLYLAEG